MTEHTMIPGHDRPEGAAQIAPTESPAALPGGHNRRKFLAGAGAAALAAATVAATASALPAAADTAGTADTTEADGAGTSEDAVVAYVSNAARGEITLFRGGHEVVVQDGKLAHALTSRIDQALARTNQER